MIKKNLISILEKEKKSQIEMNRKYYLDTILYFLKKCSKKLSLENIKNDIILGKQILNKDNFSINDSSAVKYWKFRLSVDNFILENYD